MNGPQPKRWSPLLLAAMCGGCGTSAGSPTLAHASSTTTAAATATVPEPTTSPTPPSTTGPNPEATSTGGDTGAADSTGSVKFDVGTNVDHPSVESGCRKVDFLFVIDNSGSMGAHQNRLIASFPGFIAAIQESLGGTLDGYHIGVVTSDAYVANAPDCTTLGALVTQIDGDPSGRSCEPFAEGRRFATQADDLANKFPCMANVGIWGDSEERPVSAAVAALDPAMAEPGACNDGFLRDDAILVVVVLTDDAPYEQSYDDAHPDSFDPGWYDAVVAAKNGDPEAVVVLGFVPWGDVSCVQRQMPSPNLIRFVESFGDRGVVASICGSNFAEVFADTIATITATCAGFEPPG